MSFVSSIAFSQYTSISSSLSTHPQLRALFFLEIQHFSLRCSAGTHACDTTSGDPFILMSSLITPIHYSLDLIPSILSPLLTFSLFLFPARSSHTRTHTHITTNTKSLLLSVLNVVHIKQVDDMYHYTVLLKTLSTDAHQRK